MHCKKAGVLLRESVITGLDWTGLDWHLTSKVDLKANCMSKEN